MWMLKNLGLNLFGSLAVGSFFMSAVTLFLQSYNYLKVGEWEKTSLIYYLQAFKNEWALSPQNWIGVQKIVDGIDFFIFMFYVGLFFSVCALIMFKILDDHGLHNVD
jgi:hypothetical protein